MEKFFEKNFINKKFIRSFKKILLKFMSLQRNFFCKILDIFTKLFLNNSISKKNPFYAPKKFSKIQNLNILTNFIYFISVNFTFILW